MKTTNTTLVKYLLSSLMALLFTTAYTQQWSGVTTESGNIYRTGNVGIGAPNPEGKVHIVGSSISFPATSGTSQLGLSLRLQNSGSDLVLDIGGNGGKGAWLQATNKTGLNLNYPILLNPNGGNVGIGNNNPRKKLEIGVPHTFNQDDEIRIGSYYSNNFYGIGLNYQINSAGTPFSSLVDYYGGVKYQTITLSKGKVGIGNTTPNAKLDIKVPWNNNQEEEMRIGFYNQNDANKFYGIGFNFVSDANGNPIKSIVNYENGIKYNAMSFRNGNVGIGNPSPNAKLDIKVPWNSNQEEEIRIGFYRENDVNKFYGVGFNFVSDANGNPIKSIVNYENGIKYNAMSFRNGNIGIGTANPECKLHVVGKILADEVEVRDIATNSLKSDTIRANQLTLDMPNAADYVFDPSYTLRSLDEVEEFVNTNKHLPGMPSATEFKENGVNMAEMNNLLLEKVEELTLYTIEMNKRLQALEAENQQLKQAHNQ